MHLPFLVALLLGGGTGLLNQPSGWVRSSRSIVVGRSSPSLALATRNASISYEAYKAAREALSDAPQAVPPDAGMPARPPELTEMEVMRAAADAVVARVAIAKQQAAVEKQLAAAREQAARQARLAEEARSVPVAAEGPPAAGRAAPRSNAQADAQEAVRRAADMMAAQEARLGAPATSPPDAAQAAVQRAADMMAAQEAKLAGGTARA